MEKMSNGVHYCLNKVGGRRMRMFVETTMMPSYEDRQWSLPVCFHLLPDPSRKDMTDKEEIEEIDKRVRALKKLVPGTEEMDINQLIEETVVFIDALEQKVDAMRGLASFLDGVGEHFDDFRRGMRKFGGSAPDTGVPLPVQRTGVRGQRP